MNLQEKLVRNIVKAEVGTAFPETSKDQLRDISSTLLTIQARGRTNTTAAVIRCLDQYYGVSEKTLALGSHLYNELWGDGDD